MLAVTAGLALAAPFSLAVPLRWGQGRGFGVAFAMVYWAVLGIAVGAWLSPSFRHRCSPIFVAGIQGKRWFRVFLGLATLEAGVFCARLARELAAPEAQWLLYGWGLACAGILSVLVRAEWESVVGRGGTRPPEQCPHRPKATQGCSLAEVATVGGFLVAYILATITFLQAEVSCDEGATLFGYSGTPRAR